MDILTALVAAVGLFFAGWQLREQTRQKRLDLGQFYIERYWSIDDDLLVEQKGTPAHEKHRHRYLRLFEDEFDAARLRWLDRDQWVVWHGYLDDPRQRAQIVEDLNSCDPEQKNFELLRSCLAQRVQEGGAHRPKHCLANRIG